MRIMAHVSGDSELRGLFLHSGDVYVLLASRIFDKSVDMVSKVEREQAKVICLGETSTRPDAATPSTPL
jgi:DNA polymerase I-like protein with 3'-5' exonuclease and polymerase domains